MDNRKTLELVKATREYIETAQHAMADALDALGSFLDRMEEEALQGAEIVPKAETWQPPTFTEVAAEIRSGHIDRYHCGDRIVLRTDGFGEIPFRVIGINCEELDRNPAAKPRPHLTVMAENAVLYRWFDSPHKGFPFGCNAWVDSDLRAWLNQECLDSVIGGDRDAILPVLKITWLSERECPTKTMDYFFLPSASEVGFKPGSRGVHDEGACYEYFKDATGDYDDDEPLRQLVDPDGEGAYWWLRSPNPGTAHSVRTVYPDGSLYISLAYSGYGAAPACVIG